MKRIFLPCCSSFFADVICRAQSIQDLEILQSRQRNSIGFKGSWVLNQGVRFAQEFCAEVFGACEGISPGLPGYSNFITSATGDTVLIWNETTVLDPYCHVLDLHNAPDVIYLGKFQPNGPYFLAGTMDICMRRRMRI
ncbi:MAG: hypothetical protein IPN95_06685 [Bacteroidetes bacterium]|nr:hypothetical protein [Bacteroidota bacterium]